MLRVFKHTTEEDYGLKSLGLKVQQHRAMGIELVHRLYEQFYDEPLTPKAVWLQKLEQSKHMPSTKAISAMRAITKGMYDEHKAVKSATWRKLQCEAFNKDLLGAITREAKGDFEANQLEELARKWKTYGKRAHLSDDILLELHSVFASLSLLFKKALEELEQKRAPRWYRKALPMEFYQRYKNHLIEQLATIELEQTRLADNALARLELTALHHDERRSDVIGETIAQLHELRKVNPEFAEQAKLHRQMKPTNFQALHRIVSEQGAKVHRRRLKALPWFHSFALGTGAQAIRVDVQLSRAVRTSTFASASEPMDVKRHFAKQFGVADNIPKKRKWPEWLFKGHNTRVDFFDDVQRFASDALAMHRVHTGSQGDRGLASIEQFARDAQEAGLGLTQRFEKLQRAQAPLMRGLRQYFTKDTQAFLNRIQSHVSQTQLACQGDIVHYVTGLTQSLKAQQLTPSRNLNKAMAALAQSPLCQLPSPAMEKAFRDFWGAFDEVLKQQLQRQSLLKRREALAELMEPMLTQTSEFPAEGYQVANIIETLSTFDEGDILSEYCMDLKGQLVKKAQAEFSAPSLPVELLTTESESSDSKHLDAALEQWRAQMQCFANNGTLLQALGTRSDEEKELKAKLELYRHFLLAFSGGAYAKSLSDTHRVFITDTQAKTLMTLSVDKITAQRLHTLQHLYQEKEVTCAQRIAKQELKQFERLWYQQTFEAQFQALAKRMFNWLQTEHKLRLQNPVLYFLDTLSSDMADNNSACVKSFVEHMKEGKATAKAIFDLNQVSFFSRKSKQLVLQQVVNILAKLKMAAKQLPHVLDERDRVQLIRKLNADIHQEMQTYGGGEASFTKLIHQHGTFKPCSVEVKAECPMGMHGSVPPQPLITISTL